MQFTARRGVTLAAAGLIAVAGAGVLTACGSSGGSSSSSAASSSAAPTSDQGGAGMIGPVIVEPGTTTAEVAVGRMITFKVDDVKAWTIESSDPAVLAVTQGKDDGSAQFLPGGEALAAGAATVTLKNSTTNEEWTVAVTVTQ
ncbi:MAG: hypothetical protein ACR2KE_00360 [Candidatus Nanopelagicales bacterium]